MIDAQNMQLVARVVATGAAVLAASIGCSGGSTAPNTPTAGRLIVSPPLLTLQVGGNGSLAAVVTDPSGAVIPNANVTWLSRLPLVAAVDRQGGVSATAVGSAIASISAAGVATGRTAGTTLITASARSVTSEPASLTVTNACIDPDGFTRADSFAVQIQYD